MVNSTKTYIKLCLLSLFILMTVGEGSYALLAQQPSDDAWRDLGIDALFKAARDTAFAGHRGAALQMCEVALERSPNYHDIRIFKSRVLAWEKQYEGSRTGLRKVLSQKPKHKDALSALFDVESWSGNTTVALGVADTAVMYYPEISDWRYKLAATHNKLENPKLAIPLLKEILAEEEHEKAARLLKNIKVASWKNSLAGSYGMVIGGEDTLERLEQSFRVRYGRKTKYGSLSLQYSLAERFDTIGWQLLCEAYPSLGKGLYAYLSYSYSPDKVFVDHHAAVEVFRSIGNGQEVSLGGHWIYNKKDPIDSTATNKVKSFYTGSYSKYHKNLLLSARGYISPKQTGVSGSAQFLLRKFSKSGKDWWDITVGYGIAPRQAEEVSSSVILVQEDAETINSWRINSSVNKKIGARYAVFGSAGLRRSDVTFSTEVKVWRVNASLGARMTF